MLSILESSVKIADAQERFKRSLDAYTGQRVDVTIGYQSGSHDATVTWIPSLDFWAHYGFPPSGKSYGKRYWNVFGLGFPSQLVSIVCEINPPLKGINRRVAGAFAESSSGGQFVIHRGRFNVRGGMTKEFFRHRYPKNYVSVLDGKRTSEVIMVGELGTRSFGERLANFIVEVGRIKNIARGS